jgi:type IV secretion system protein VirB2
MHHPRLERSLWTRFALPAVLLLLAASAPELSWAQTSPFMTGATALQTNIIAWLTPVAIILIMVLGGMAMANRMSWGWCLGAILGIAIAFGAPQIVTWVRGMFGV